MLGLNTNVNTKSDGLAWNMKIAIGSDHRGFEAKKQIKAIIQQLGHECVDVGTNSNDPVDYPDAAYIAALAVSSSEVDRAILACGTGIGMSITANRFKGVRAGLCHNIYTARMARLHNNANILVMGGRVIGDGLAIEMLDVLLLLNIVCRGR